MLPGGVSATIIRLTSIGGSGGGWFRPNSDELLTLCFTAFAGIAVFAAVFFIFTTRVGCMSMRTLRRPSPSPAPPSSWNHLRSALFVAVSSPPSPCSPDRGNLKSPWSRSKRKNALSPEQWRNLFTPEGKLHDRGVKFLKKVRSGGVDPSIRSEVWPFLLGVYGLDTSNEEREAIRTKNRKEYEKLVKQCRRLLKKSGGICRDRDYGSSDPGLNSPDSRDSLCSEESSPLAKYSNDPPNALLDGDASSARNTYDSESSDSDSSQDPEDSNSFPSTETREENEPSSEVQSKLRKTEDFATWQRIIRLDAIRTNDEWIAFSPSQATISKERAKRAASAVGLKDYEHLEPSRIFHAARLVAILEAYALYDPEIGYCQGMSDLLSPIISIITEDYMAFWCFAAFMKKARHNFRLDEVGIRRQLSIVSKIIKYRDSHLYRHLEKLQAEDCFFVYRMVVVLFRRELTFEQTICLWEVMWADQAEIRAGIGKSAWSRIRLRAPPTEDLLLYAVAASVLQRRKLIIERYSSMDEIIRECNSMAGHLDVWKLLDDAHDLVVNLHDKV